VIGAPGGWVAEIRFNAVQPLFDEQGRELHRLNAKTVRARVQAVQGEAAQRHDAPLGPRRVGGSPAGCRDAETACEIRGELGSSEGSGTGGDTSSALGAETLSELVEVESGLGHRNLPSKGREGEVLVIDDEPNLALSGFAPEAATEVAEIAAALKGRPVR
jgi:hypothetical protein